MNNQSVSLVATTNIKQDWQKIWQPTVEEVLVLKQQTNKNHPPSTNQKIVCTVEPPIADPLRSGLPLYSGQTLWNGLQLT